MADKVIRIKDHRPQDAKGHRYTLHRGNVLDVYSDWEAPDLIVSDGAYGVRGFRGDTVSADGLVDWYAPHVIQWSKRAKPSTSLWFWNTEVGWATVHPLLEANGWEYVQLVTWDKGLSHIAGNVNGNTIRQFPVVTEVSALYRRKLTLPAEDGNVLGVQQWLRAEWQRSGLPLYRANEACGVKNAATRKYLTADWLWYWPPGEMVERMAEYTKANGKPTNRPYFSVDGHTEITAERWDSLRAVWNHVNGLTNVWSRPPLHDGERLKGTLQRSAPPRLQVLQAVGGSSQPEAVGLHGSSDSCGFQRGGCGLGAIRRSRVRVGSRRAHRTYRLCGRDRRGIPESRSWTTGRSRRGIQDENNERRDNL
ncbi:DNA methylase [Bifidobacterium adolescentis]|nr:site-specific DNA-methyltransferase [Bifidobacterium adolescentis]OSH06167.1 DNA methylase [Bifidobacterium adolescentis]